MQWHATLELAYARRGERTVPVTRRHLGPVRVQKHFHPEASGLCQHVLIHPPAGLVGGDQVGIEVTVGATAEVQLTTPGATKVYRTAGLEAGQTLTARVEAGGWLEWLPQETIVYDQARARLACAFALDPTARLIAWDVLALGAAEPFAKGSVRQTLGVTIGGAAVLDERAHYDARLRESPLGLGGARVHAMLVAIGDPTALDAAVVDACRAFDAPTGTASGARVTRLVEEGRAIVIGRWLGAGTEQARRWLVALWRILRPALAGVAPLMPRIWRT